MGNLAKLKSTFSSSSGHDLLTENEAHAIFEKVVRVRSHVLTLTSMTQSVLQGPFKDSVSLLCSNLVEEVSDVVKCMTHVSSASQINLMKKASYFKSHGVKVKFECHKVLNVALSSDERENCLATLSSHVQSLIETIHDLSKSDTVECEGH